MPLFVHPGMFGPHCGTGMFAVADIWLEMAGMVLGEVAAAAAPATTTDRAKMRMASDMIDNLYEIEIDKSAGSRQDEMLEQNGM